MEYNSVIRIVQECVIDDSILLPLVTPSDKSQLGAEKMLNILDCLTTRALSLFPIPNDHALINIKNLSTIEKLLELSIVEEIGSYVFSVC